MTKQQQRVALTVSRETWKRVVRLKLDQNIFTVDAIVRFLLDEFEKGK